MAPREPVCLAGHQTHAVCVCVPVRGVKKKHVLTTSPRRTRFPSLPFSDAHLGRSEGALTVADLRFRLSLLGHLRQTAPSGVDEPVADLEYSHQLRFPFLTSAVPCPWKEKGEKEKRAKHAKPTHLADRQTGLAHEDLFFLLGGIRVRDVLGEPDAEGVRHGLGQVPAAPLLFAVAVVGNAVEA